VLVHTILANGSLSVFDCGLLFVVGSVAGYLMVDLEKVIIGSLLSFGLCVLILFVELSLAAVLGIVSNAAFNQIVYIQAARIIFPNAFPVPFIINIVSSILGEYMGERF
jgi:hypothetical protein